MGVMHRTRRDFETPFDQDLPKDHEMRPEDALLGDIDVALTFASRRDLLDGDDVSTVLSAVDHAMDAVRASDDGRLDAVAGGLSERALVASNELVDLLLDLRLEVAAGVAVPTG
jgi:hypothetical protein